MNAPTVEAVESKKRMGRVHFCRVLGFAGVAFFFISAFTPVPNILSRWLGSPSRLEPAQAIVVLGGGVSPDGVLSDSSMRRAIYGILLHRKGLASRLVFFGSASDAGSSEAEIRAEMARELGVSPEVILAAPDARTTREEAVFGETLLRARGVRRILLVTNAVHMTRAQALFERAGFEVLAAPAHEVSSGVSNPEGRLRLMRRMLEELIARLYYRVAGYL